MKTTSDQTQRFDVLVYSEQKGGRTVARCVSIYAAERIERERAPQHVSITVSQWTPDDLHRLPPLET